MGGTPVFLASMQFSPDRLVEIASTRLPEQYGDLRRDGLARLLDQVTDPTMRCMFSGLDEGGELSPCVFIRTHARANARGQA